MGYLSGGHIWLLLILLVIVLIIWGPGKLPDVGSGMGKAIREFRKSSSDTRNEFSKGTHGDEPASAAVRPEPVPPTAGVAPPPPPAMPTSPPPNGAAPLGSSVPGAWPADQPR